MTYDPLLDSSNMGMEDWARMASDIKRHYCDFDAFIILHGTDTMCYTASALSFMLENLGKTVIITGSQVVCGCECVSVSVWMWVSVSVCVRWSGSEGGRGQEHVCK